MEEQTIDVIAHFIRHVTFNKQIFFFLLHDTNNRTFTVLNRTFLTRNRQKYKNFNHDYKSANRDLTVVIYIVHYADIFPICWQILIVLT